MIVNLSSSMIEYLNNSLSIVFDVLLGVSGALFLSFDFQKFKCSIQNKLPKKIKNPLIFYFKSLCPIIYKYFLGLLIDSVFIFIISIVGFSLIKVEYPLVISIIIAITNLIPIIGPYIGGVPAVIVGFSVSTTMGISALVVVLVVQLIESNFVQPIIFKNIISLHPLEGILGISLFGSLFGIVGMIFSPLIIISIKLLFVPYNEELFQNTVTNI
jgi:predicted PurR-regulated permease PerM